MIVRNSPKILTATIWLLGARFRTKQWQELPASVQARYCLCLPEGERRNEGVGESYCQVLCPEHVHQGRMLEGTPLCAR
jgi:hypothetical protein